jgi:hypothetical protein
MTKILKIPAKRKGQWSMTELSVIRRKYLTHEVKEIATEIGRSTGQVYRAANKLGLRKPMERSIPQAKLLRLMQLIVLLSRDRLTINDIAYKLGTSARSAYRYVILIRVTGFMIEKDSEQRYYVQISSCPCCGHQKALT